MWYVIIPRYISISPKRMLRNNNDIIRLLAGDNKLYELGQRALK